MSPSSNCCFLGILTKNIGRNAEMSKSNHSRAFQNYLYAREMSLSHKLMENSKYPECDNWAIEGIADRLKMFERM